MVSLTDDFYFGYYITMLTSNVVYTTRLRITFIGYVQSEDGKAK
jgi:hypothetical protein